MREYSYTAAASSIAFRLALELGPSKLKKLRKEIERDLHQCIKDQHHASTYYRSIEIQWIDESLSIMSKKGS